MRSAASARREQLDRSRLGISPNALLRPGDECAAEATGEVRIAAAECHCVHLLARPTEVSFEDG